MSNEEFLIEMTNVNSEHLNESARKLFDAIIRVIDERDELIEKNNKAIEYIKKQAILGETRDGKIYYLKDDNVGKELLSILKGENNGK